VTPSEPDIESEIGIFVIALKAELIIALETIVGAFVSCETTLSTIAVAELKELIAPVAELRTGVTSPTILDTTGDNEPSILVTTDDSVSVTLTTSELTTLEAITGKSVAKLVA